jgi:demethylmenaquinone methyltransferase/2-methoxy-6-polyprenyl-1,4-benzoquinol methylase
MSCSSPNPKASHAERVRALFSAIAHRYDLINDLQSLGLHRLWKRRMVEWAAVGPGQRALDLCCGTGDVAWRLAARGAEVVGLDFSEPMLQRARCRAAQHPALAARLQFVQGDALRVPFADNTFDAVTIAYGLRNLTDWLAGLREMLRVCKPGGRLVILDFGKPAWPLWRKLYFGYLRFVVPAWGRWMAGDRAAYAYILESLESYPAQQGVFSALQELGCRQVEVRDLLGGAMSLHRAVKPG